MHGTGEHLLPEEPGLYPYYTWETLTARLQQLAAAHPEIVNLHSAGKSVLGLDLWLVEIADHSNPDKLPLTSREVVWLDGGTHANEQTGTVLAMLWVERLLDGSATDPTARWIVENRHTFILPMLNPDGNHLDTRKNVRQVDLNRNYPVGWRANSYPWGIASPTYPGPGPLSEPETQAIVTWVRAIKPDYFNSFHAGTELMLYPFGYTSQRPADDALYARICAELSEPSSECGPVYSTIYPAHGSSLDTAYTETGAVAFSYEVAYEQGLYLSLEDPRLRMDRFWLGTEHAFLNVDKYGARLRATSARLVQDTPQAIARITLTSDGYANASGAEVSVTFPDGATATTAAGSIQTGSQAEVDVSVPGTAQPGQEVRVVLTYPQRLQASPVAARETTLTLLP